MQALLLKNIGENYDLEYTSVEKPSIKHGQALIRVLYCGVNHLDFLIATGKRAWSKKFPHILGSEIVGKIDFIGKNDNGLKKGDNVCVYPWIHCGICPSCLRGNIQICDNGGTIGRTSWGGYAEFVSVPIRNLIKIPPGLSLEDVCSVALTGTTAYHLIQRVNIPDKSLILITGATGGVGVLLIQLLKQKKCTIVATTSSKSKRNKLKKLGVCEIFMLQKFPSNTKKRYAKGFPFIIDIMGGRVWSDCIKILAKNGSMSFCSTTLEDMGVVHVGSSFSREVNIFGSYGGTIDDFKAVIQLLKNDILKPKIYAKILLKDGEKALEILRKKKAFGKILLKATV